MPDRWNTYKVNCDGGLVQNLDVLTLADTMPGAAAELVNFEGDLNGGYRRISGYTEFGTGAVPTGCIYAASSATSAAGFYGTSSCIYASLSSTPDGPVLGVKVYLSGAIAARGENIWYSTGSSWAKINTSAVATTPGKYRFDTFNWTVPSIIMANGAGYAIHYSGSTLTTLNTSGAPVDPKYVAEFKQHIFLAGYSSNPNAILHTAPSSYTDFSAINGASEIVVGDEVMNIKKYRNDLIIFCRNSLHRLVGDNVFNFQLQKITGNIGCIASDSVQEYNTDLVFLAPDGLRTIASTDRVGDTEMGLLSKPIQPAIRNLISTYAATGTFSSLVLRSKSQYRLFTSLDTYASSNMEGIIACATKSDGGLEWGKLKGFDGYSADSGYIGTTEYALHGGRDGSVYRQEQGSSFNGSNVYAVYKTPQFTFSDPTIRKTLYKLNTYYRIEGTTAVTVGVLLDYEDTSVLQPPNYTFTNSLGVSIYGTSIYNTNSYGGLNFPVAKNNIVGSGYTAGLTYTSNDTNAPYSINSLVLQYGVNGRR